MDSVLHENPMLRPKRADGHGPVGRFKEDRCDVLDAYQGPVCPMTLICERSRRPHPPLPITPARHRRAGCTLNAVSSKKRRLRPPHRQTERTLTAVLGSDFQMH